MARFLRRQSCIKLLSATTLIFLSATLPSAGQSFFRIKASSPEKLLNEIYNNALAGNDRLSDIENYMSSGLKGDYKKAVKSVKKGKECQIPRILSNGIFSGKMNGFKVEAGEPSGRAIQAKVTLDTGAKNLPQGSELKSFDPKVYEVVTFSLVKPLLDWKIDNITASEPDVAHVASGVNYLSIDLREKLKACK